LYVGRIAHEKKVDFLLDSYLRVRDRLDERVALVFVGDGPATAVLRERAP
jgi:glycosyltransferase involved in cell wall biosynthesis